MPEAFPAVPGALVPAEGAQAARRSSQAPSCPGQPRCGTPLKQCWNFKVHEQCVFSPSLVFLGTAGLFCWNISNKSRLEQVSVKGNSPHAVWKGCRAL